MISFKSPYKKSQDVFQACEKKLSSKEQIRLSIMDDKNYSTDCVLLVTLATRKLGTNFMAWSHKRTHKKNKKKNQPPV